MNLTTKRLLFNEIDKTDLENIHHLHSVPEVDQYNTLGIPSDLEETTEIMMPDILDQNHKKRARFAWKINLKNTHEFIGLAGMFLSNDKYNSASFYYKFYPKFWGHGFATETAKEIIRFGFEVCKLHRVEAGAETENLASIRVLEKAGMQKEGMHRKILPIRGQWKDNFHFAIVEDDYFKNVRS